MFPKCIVISPGNKRDSGNYVNVRRVCEMLSVRSSAKIRFLIKYKRWTLLISISSGHDLSDLKERSYINFY